MTTIKIETNEEVKEYKARTDFAFARKADEKYNKEDENGNKMGGFMSMYLGLLDEDLLYLSAFWDCALSHLKERPAVYQIEESLYKQVEEKGDDTPLFKQALTTLDDAGFFKKKAKSFWKDLDKMKDMGKDEEEKKKNAEMAKELKARHKRITS